MSGKEERECSAPYTDTVASCGEIGQIFLGFAFGGLATSAFDAQYYSPWWLERGGPTRSHSEHGSETSQR